MGAELRRCLNTTRSVMLIAVFGVAVGLSLALQGTIQYVLCGAGFTDLEAAHKRFIITQDVFIISA